MKKHLPADAITNELAGASAFFKPPAPPSPAAPQVTEKPAASLPSQPTSPPPMQPAREPTRPPAKKEPSQKASVLASYPPELIETIRRTVKRRGKEVSFVRLTQTEKDQLTDIVYTYKRRGMKTTENEINRIAINYLLEDYQHNGEESLLAQVIDALLA